jgi:hypothetical protein
MIILWKSILISFYKVDIENTPFNPDTVWHYTLKRFVDLALAQAHEARTLQLRAISTAEDPPSLSQFQARLAPLATVFKRGSRARSYSRDHYTTTSSNSTSSDTPSTSGERESGTAISNQSCRLFEKNTKNGNPNPSQNINSRSQWVTDTRTWTTL